MTAVLSLSVPLETGSCTSILSHMTGDVRLLLVGL